MPPAPIPTNENDRLAALISCNVLDTPPEACFDDLTRLAAMLCDTPIALVSLLDDTRQWFKSRVGLDAPQTPRGSAFCGYAILRDRPLIIPDALLDERTRDNPLVLGPPNIRFYAGVPLILDGGLPAGTLCVIDQKPRKATSKMIGYLEALALQAASQLTLRRTASNLEVARRSANDANQAKSAFLAHMSHEVRTPLTSIVGYADLLRRRGEGVIDTAPAIDAIARNAQHLLEVVNDVLDISKIEAGMMTIDCCAVDPTDVLADVISLAEPRAKEKSLPLKVSFISPTPTSIEIDPVRIRQVLLNLIYNAIKFTDSGQIGVDVSACPKDRSLTVVVRDTGPGMTPEQIVKISKFEAFCQADNSTTRRFGGTGLGLSIAHTLVNMLDGELSVESAIGKGSSFTITLHTSHTSKVATWRSAAEARSVLISSVQHRHATTTNSDDALVTELSECRILLAEDSPDSQRLIALHLHRAGAEVDLASDGNEVFSLALDSTNADVSPYSVVLMDVDMPGIDGYEATKRLRDHGYDRPIIILSAHALSDSRSRGYQAGADDHLTKPIDPTRLIDACSRWATVER